MSGTGFHTITLGCKLNQFDGAAIEGELVRRGLRPVDDAACAGVVVINTCTVTHRADSDARKLIRSVRRVNPTCRLLVTGCYAEREPGALEDLAVDRVFGNRDKPRLGSILDELGIGVVSPGAAAADRGCDAALALPEALHFGHRSRAFLKVQEGCRLRCSYCIIPEVRGPSRSVPVERALAAARRLLGDGFHEIVLTGVNTGDYGRDLDPPTNLAALLRALLAGCATARFRLNSLEPLTVTDEIVALLAAEPRLLPHLQVPLQSAAPRILRRMRRNYTVEAYLERLRRLRAAVPAIGLGADVIVGFPGETDDEFERTRRTIADSPLSYLHVFSWSPRPGTPAAELDDRVDPRTIRLRSQRLRALGRRLSLRFRRGFEGRLLDGVVLGGPDAPRRRALTGNFIEVAVASGPTVAAGSPVRLRILAAGPDGTTALIEGPAERPAPAAATA